MRAGYSGRAIVYVVVAVVSLWAIWHGQQAKGTGSAFATLETSAWGVAVLIAIAVGMMCYAVWRMIDATFDLEDYGSDGKGAVARIGMVVTGLIHLAIGLGALLLVFTTSSGGGQSTIAQVANKVMSWPGGRWIVGIAGLATIGAAFYYLHEAWSRNYRQNLVGNEFTRNWDAALRIGVASQGFVVAVIGAFLIYTAIIHSGSQAGGIEKTFSWLADQPYGRILVAALCVGLLCFALFCAVNAAYRSIPKARGGDIETLAAKIKSSAT